MASKFYQRYPLFLVRHSNGSVAVVKLLPVFYTQDKWPRLGTFVTRDELDRYLHNSGTKLLVEICLNLLDIIKILSCTLLESSYEFKINLIIVMDVDISIILCQGLSEKKLHPFYFAS